MLTTLVSDLLQFRMHDSTNCRIFLQITSTPIIERCRGLLFGPYPPFLSVSCSRFCARLATLTLFFSP